MLNQYRISWKHLYLHSMGMIVGCVAAALAPVFLTYKSGPSDDLSYYWASLFGFSVFFIPYFIIQLRYFFLDRGKTLLISSDLKSYELKLRNSMTIAFSTVDIKLVEYTQSYVLANNKGSMFPWEMNNFSKIYLHDGRIILITSLLIPKLEIPLPPESIKLRTRFYCYPYSAKEVL